MLMQTSGLGSLKPNVVMFGMRHRKKSNKAQAPDSQGGAPAPETTWSDDTNAKGAQNYVNALRDCFDMGLGVMVGSGLDKLDWTAASAYEGKVKPDFETGVNTIDVLVVD
eukprot:TRINITY_DN259_c0_g1_i1.p4 TRINITY_DN259_c0_g1~~TRINITY_DN259_c0_g1_i1.p4  ORF type:complete len:110 (-),score=19.19 TRINITY_DN259_c0_g1_i1:627-956(-)